MSRNRGSDKPKKPIYKKWWFWVIVVIVLAAAFGNKGDKDGGADQAAAPATETSAAFAPEAAEETAAPAEDAAPAPAEDVNLKFGDLISIIDIPGKNGVVIKAKITSSWTNELTVNQNYISVADLILNQGFDQYEEIQYWAVADMTSGDEQKVISFTLNDQTIKGIAAGNIIDIELGDYADDLFIHQSLR